MNKLSFAKLAEYCGRKKKMSLLSVIDNIKDW